MRDHRCRRRAAAAGGDKPDRPGLAGDFLYERERARNICVHPAAVIEALEVIYGGDSLVRELENAN